MTTTPITLDMGERNMIVSALGIMLAESTRLIEASTTEDGRQIVRDVYGDPDEIRAVRDHITHGDLDR